MHRLLPTVTAFALIVTAATLPAHAQGPIEFHAGLGLAIPMGDFSESFTDGENLTGLDAATGFIGTLGATIRPATLPVGFRLDGSFMRHGVTDDFKAQLTEEGFSDDLNYRALFGTANVVYTFETDPTSMLHPYVIGGVGVYSFSAGGDTADEFEGLAGSELVSGTKLGFNVGAGVDVRMTGVTLFAEGRFHVVPGVEPLEGLGLDDLTLRFVPIVVGLKVGR